MNGIRPCGVCRCPRCGTEYCASNMRLVAGYLDEAIAAFRGMRSSISDMLEQVEIERDAARLNARLLVNALDADGRVHERVITAVQGYPAVPEVESGDVVLDEDGLIVPEGER